MLQPIDLACRNIVSGATRAIGDLPLKIDLHRLPRTVHGKQSSMRD
jgi:hypothetical protein